LHIFVIIAKKHEMTHNLKDRTYLHERHRLSHQQIDTLLGENRCKEFLKEKLSILESVKNFIAVVDFLNLNNIRVVSLKGPMLSNRIYGDPAVRLSHDIDLLIDKKNIEVCHNLMLSKGFRLSHGIVWPENKTKQKLLVSSLHHLSYYSKGLNCYVELHWELMHNLPVSWEVASGIIDNNIVETEFYGKKIYLLSKEMELLFLMMHGAKHGWSRLKWLVDINDYPSGDIDIVKFNSLVKRFKAERIVTQTNILLKKFFDKELPFTGKNLIDKYLISYPLKSIEDKISTAISMKNHLKNLRYSLLLFSDISYKIKIIKSYAFRSSDLNVFNSKYKFVYYIYHPYSLIKRRIFYAR